MVCEPLTAGLDRYGSYARRSDRPQQQPPLKLQQLASEICQLLEAIEHWPNSPPRAVVAAQAALGLAAPYLPKVEKYTMWCRQRLTTPRWYANRGIPYRRGYLFAGPPGTGKSSLAWAIAGVFGLDIYCISLVEPSLTEEDLGLMFTSLPRRCVVLLEDIDSAGLIKRQEAEVQTNKSKEDDAAAKLGAEICKALTTAQQNNDKNNKNNQGISLSGLLNAIDGVASHEGRVLVMTSNFPEKLDNALIRPGRIDMRIDFTKATRSQMTELFTRMYSPDTTAKPTKLITASTTSGHAPATAVHKIKEDLQQPFTNGHLPAQELTPPKSPREPTTPSGASKKTPALTTPASDLTALQLHEIASAFAASLDENTYTPAEIQGFLLTRKKEPVKALSEVTAWKVSVLEARGGGEGAISTSIASESEGYEP